MIEWMLAPLRNYAGFTGRARRKEYWLFILFLFLATIVTQTLDTLLGFGSVHSEAYRLGWTGWVAVSATGGWISHLFHLAMFIPSLAVSVRRLHDGDHSAWLLLWVLVPLIGWIVLLILYILEGTRGPNRFGPDPLAS